MTNSFQSKKKKKRRRKQNAEKIILTLKDQYIVKTTNRMNFDYFQIITLRRLIAEYEEGRNIDPNIPGSSAVKSVSS